MENTLIESYKNILKNERKELIGKVNALHFDKRRGKEAVSQDFEDQAQEVESDEVIDKLETIETVRLEQVENALQRIRTGYFGICLNCNEEISGSRLKAIPEAAICIKCCEEKSEV